MTVDSFLMQIGWTRGGWYPIGPYFCMWLLLICHAMHVMTGAFSAWTPKGVECRTPSADPNSTAKCTLKTNSGSVEQCESWSYGVVTRKDQTLVHDFDLVCDDEYITMLINSLYVAGVFFGNVFLGSLPDKFGRKIVCLLANWMLGVTALVFAFLNDIYSILIFRFIGGVFYSMTQFTVWMWVTELFSTHDRFLPVGMAYHGWSSGLVIISGLAWIFRSWRHLHLVVAAFCFTSVFLYFLMPESLYWLERNKKRAQIDAIMEAINARKCLVGLYGNETCSRRRAIGDEHGGGGSDDDAAVALQLRGVEEATNNNNGMAPVATPGSHDVAKSQPRRGSGAGRKNSDAGKHRRRSRTLSTSSLHDAYAYGSKIEPKTTKFTKTYWVCLLLCSTYWFIDGLLYYGLQFSTQEFAGDRFLNFFLFSVVEYPATMLAFALGKFTTRRFSLLFLHVMCGAAMVISAVLRWTEALKNDDPVFNVLNIVAKFFVTACFSVMCYVPAEVFPTNVRNTSFNINASFSRIAAILGTFMPYFFRKDAALAECIFGLMGILAGLTSFYMPESKNRPLPKNMEDLEMMAATTGPIWRMKY